MKSYLLRRACACRRRELIVLGHREDVRQCIGQRSKLLWRRHLQSLELDVLVAIHTSTRRDEVTDDDVLLEAKEIVLRTADRRDRKNTRGLLERSCRDERLRGERRL